MVNIKEIYKFDLGVKGLHMKKKKNNLWEREKFDNAILGNKGFMTSLNTQQIVTKQYQNNKFYYFYCSNWKACHHSWIIALKSTS